MIYILISNIYAQFRLEMPTHGGSGGQERELNWEWFVKVGAKADIRYEKTESCGLCSRGTNCLSVFHYLPRL